MDQKQAQTIIDRCQREAPFFHERILGRKRYWSKQKEVVLAVDKNKRVAVRSCYNIGKSYVVAGIALDFLYRHKPSKVVATAPTGRQAKEILWSELSAAYRDSTVPLGGDLGAGKLTLQEDWFAIAFSTEIEKVDDVAKKIQGYHSPNILFILEEAAGIHPKIWDAIEGGLSSEGSKVVAIGNPASASGRFYNCFTSPLWHKIEISAYDSPNFTGEGDGDYPFLISKQWVKEREEEWGRDNPLFVSKVLGDFPQQGTDSLFGLKDLEDCIDLELPATGAKTITIDPARFGDDLTSFTLQQGKRVLLIDSESGWNLMRSCGKAIKMKQDHRSSAFIADEIGVGGGLIDRLIELDHTVYSFNSAAASSSKEFVNLRAEAYWKLARDVKQKLISLPRNETLIAQLAGLKYKFNSKGQILIESKEDMKKRGLKSPDLADGVMMSNWFSTQMEMMEMREKNGGLVMEGSDRETARQARMVW